MTAETGGKRLLEKAGVPYKEITYGNQVGSGRAPPDCTKYMALARMGFRSGPTSDAKTEEIINNFSFHPDCLGELIKKQAEESKEPIVGFMMGLSGSILTCDLGRELIWMPVDDETFMVATFDHFGGAYGASCNLGLGAVQGMLYGDCPDGMLSYEGQFFNLSFATQTQGFGGESHIVSSVMQAMVGADFFPFAARAFSKEGKKAGIIEYPEDPITCYFESNKNTKDLKKIVNKVINQYTILPEDLKKKDKSFIEKILEKFVRPSGCNLYSVNKGLNAFLFGVGATDYALTGSVFFVKIKKGDPQSLGPTKMIEYINKLNESKNKNK